MIKREQHNRAHGGSTAPRTDARGNPVQNLILIRIPHDEYTLLRPQLEFIRTNEYERLHESGERLQYAYFPNSGMASLVAEVSDGRTLEVGIVTKFGFIGELLHSSAQFYPFRIVTQPAIEGYRVRSSALTETLSHAPELRRRMGRFIRFQGLRVSQIAACNRFHEIEQRLARWLLMSQDRLGSTVLPFTHDFLASVLGTGRPSVSIAASAMQKERIIHYRSGSVTVSNRRALEQIACECYRAIRQFEAELQAP